MSCGKIVQSKFKPAWWLPDGHSQTIWPCLLRKLPELNYHPECLELPDGDFVDLCWTGNTSGPIVAVFHGLEGCISSHYAQSIMAKIHIQGWRGVFMHFRGCSGKVNRLDRSYHSGDTGDIAFLLKSLRRRYPQTSLGAIGYSLGGNALLKYLGESGEESLVESAVAVSVPYVLQDSVSHLSQGLSRLYQHRLIRLLHKKTQAKLASRNDKLTTAELSSLDTLYKFDDRITAPIHGFIDADDYYTHSSSRSYLNKIRIPTLLLHARNDPIMTPKSIPSNNELSKSVILEVSDNGGHVGFVGGSMPWTPEFWLEQRIPNFLTNYF